jgi:hypothetical protein
MKTLTDIPVDLQLRVSPKLNLNRSVDYTAVLNPSEIIYKEINSNNFSTSNFTINCVFNSRALIDTATAVLKSTFRLTFTGVAGDGINLLQIKGAPSVAGVSSGSRSLDAPRSYPLASILQSLSVSLEGMPVNGNISQYWPCISRYYNDRASQDLYQCPSMLDNTQSYNDNPEFSATDPLGSFSSNSSQLPRGGWGDLLVEQNDAGIAIVTFTTFEPIYVSPFVYGADRKEASMSSPLTGINNMNITGVFAGNNGGLPAAVSPLARIWSHRNATLNPSVINSIAVEVLGVSACISYYQAPVTYPLQNQYVFPWYDYIPVQTNLGEPIPANDRRQLQFNTQTLSSVPSRVFVWVARQNNLNSFTTTDTALKIENVAIIFNGKQGILSNATSQQLYAISRANGLVDSYSDFNSRVGSFCCFKFGDDIPMNPDLSVGVSGSFEFFMTVTASNKTSQPIPVALNVTFQYEGILMQRGTQWSQTTGALTRRNVVELQAQAVDTGRMITYNPQEMLNGGSIIGNIGKFIGRAIMNYTPQGRAFKTVASTACSLSGNKSGFCDYIKGGDDGGDDGGYIGGVRRKMKRKSRKMSRKGGEGLSRSQLKALMN